MKGKSLIEYKTLIIAGIGGIGKGLFTLGGDIFQNFQRIIAIDMRDEREFFKSLNYSIDFFQGDVTDDDFMTGALEKVSGNGIFLNVCAGVDTVRLRRTVSSFNLGYIDAGASSMDQGGDCFSQLMPYTNTACHDGKPHLICQGINPGMVEIVARILMQDLRAKGGREFDISVFEYDSLFCDNSSGRLAVGWNVEDMVEEMIFLPGLEYADSGFILNDNKGGRKSTFVMDGQRVACRVIGHEDVWNLGLIDGVKSVKFCYGLHDGVMKALDNAERKEQGRLFIPQKCDKIRGNDKIVVKVVCRNINVASSLAWQVDHFDIWNEFGINGVVFQTCKSLLFSLLLMLDGCIGSKTGTFTGSTIEISKFIFDDICDKLDIAWEKVDPDYARICS